MQSVHLLAPPAVNNVEIVSPAALPVCTICLQPRITSIQELLHQGANNIVPSLSNIPQEMLVSIWAMLATPR